MSWLGICCDRLVNVKRAANTVEDEQVQLLKTVNCFWGKCGGRHFKPFLSFLSLSLLFSHDFMSIMLSLPTGKCIQREKRSNRGQIVRHLLAVLHVPTSWRHQQRR